MDATLDMRAQLQLYATNLMKKLRNFLWFCFLPAIRVKANVNGSFDNSLWNRRNEYTTVRCSCHNCFFLFITEGFSS